MVFLNKLNIRINQDAYLKKILKKIYGLNNYRIKKLLQVLGIPFNKYYKSSYNSLSLEFKNIFFDLLNNKDYLSKNLKIVIYDNINFYKKQIKGYKGYRHLRSLPVRGQRTRTNAKSVKKIKNNIF